MTTKKDLPGYRWAGARAQVLMHEQSMREFVSVWQQAKARNLPLPQTEDPCYDSLAHLLRHVLSSARNYMVWICEKLEYPDPGIEPPSPVEQIEAEAAQYLDYLIAGWREPLRNLDEERASRPSYKSRWDMDYSIDSMLEHAVMHPQRHTFQLRELMA
jgi:hypothetical protein